MNAAPMNPLAAAAAALPPGVLRAASVALRLAAAGLSLSVAFDQSYDPTQYFTVIIAGLVLATVILRPGVWGDLLATFGAGTAFFAGAVLTHLAAGGALLVVGALAALAALALAHRESRGVTWPALAFLAAAALTAAIQVGIVFAFE